MLCIRTLAWRQRIEQSIIIMWWVSILWLYPRCPAEMGITRKQSLIDSWQPAPNIKNTLDPIQVHQPLTSAHRVRELSSSLQHRSNNDKCIDSNRAHNQERDPKSPPDIISSSSLIDDRSLLIGTSLWLHDEGPVDPCSRSWRGFLDVSLNLRLWVLYRIVLISLNAV